MGFYNCPRRNKNGEICNRGCYRKEGCTIHWKSRKRVPCSVCGIKWTSSKYGVCREHSGRFRSEANYNKKKLKKLYQEAENEDKKMSTE